MYKRFPCRLVLFLFLILPLLMTACHSADHEKKIGIILPIEHKALDEIVEGFKTTLTTKAHVPLRFKVANAQGDLNLQRAIIQQMQSKEYALIIPVGTAATQMAVAMVHDKPIIGLAANFSEAERQQQKSCNIAIVHDEIPPEKIIHFIHQAYPSMRYLMLIHSNAEKVFPDVKTAVAAGKNLGITVKPFMITAANELYSVANALPQQTQAIFILKDHLIVSGISTLVRIAEKKHIPLITSDQGSVQEGASFALGVRERAIGTEGAVLAAAVLAGKPACQIPMVNMTHLAVFMNQQSLSKAKQPISAIRHAAEKQAYTIELVDRAGK